MRWRASPWRPPPRPPSAGPPSAGVARSLGRPPSLAMRPRAMRPFDAAVGPGGAHGAGIRDRAGAGVGWPEPPSLRAGSLRSDRDPDSAQSSAGAACAVGPRPCIRAGPRLRRWGRGRRRRGPRDGGRFGAKPGSARSEGIDHCHPSPSDSGRRFSRAAVLSSCALPSSDRVTRKPARLVPACAAEGAIGAGRYRGPRAPQRISLPVQVRSHCRFKFGAEFRVASAGAARGSSPRGSVLLGKRICFVATRGMKLGTS